MFAYIQFPAWLTPEIIPGFPLRWYGIMYILAFSTTYLLFSYQLKREKHFLTQDDAISLFLWTILGLLIGARILATLVYDPTGYYLRHPWMIFWPFRNGQFTGLQGMSYHGGVIGAIVGGFLYCRKQKVNFFQVADLVTAGIPLGYTFGRLGNFINGELWGRVSTGSLGMVFPRAARFSSSIQWVRDIADKLGIPYTEGSYINLPRHPSQLYEALFEGVVLWLFIWFIARRHKKFHGYILSLYMIGYGTIRFVIEYFREPDRDLGFVIALGAESEPTALLLSVWNFSMGQLLNAIMAAAGVVLFLWCRNREENQLGRKPKPGGKNPGKPGKNKHQGKTRKK